MTTKASEKTSDPTLMIYPAIRAVMDNIEAIGKDSRNEMQNFMFRGIDAAYNALHPLMAANGIITVPKNVELLRREERPTRTGGVISFTLIKVEYDFISTADGSSITVGPLIGEGMDSGDKGCNKALAVAHKYALFQTFLIPTEKSDDPDRDSYELGQPAVAVNKPAAVPKPQPAPPPSDLSIPDEESAAGVADMIISLAVGMHGNSAESLYDFWKKNIKPIDHLKTHFPQQYARVQAAFAEAKSKVQQETTL